MVFSIRSFVGNGSAVGESKNVWTKGLLAFC